jgi:hypothetical protein
MASKQELEILVNLIKRGEGAKLAEQEVRALDAATKQLNQSQQQSSAGAATLNRNFQVLNQGATAARQNVQALQSATLLLGTQAFPKASAAAFTAITAFQGAGAAARILGTSMGPLLAALVGVASAIKLVNEALDLFAAKKALAGGLAGAGAQAQSLLGTINASIAEREQAGALTSAEASDLRERLRLLNGQQGSIGASADLNSLAQISKEIRAATTGGFTESDPAKILAAVREQMQHQQALNPLSEYQFNKMLGDALVNALANLPMESGQYKDLLAGLVREYDVNQAGAVAGGRAERNRLLGPQTEKAKMQAEFAERRRLLEDYYAFEVEKAQANAERITQIESEKSAAFQKLLDEQKKALDSFHGQIVQFANKVSTILATELSRGIVDAFRNGKFEADKFFSDLLAMIAEAALQQALAGILGSAGTGGNAGTGLFGLLFGAKGGVFPRMMAGGGLAGRELNQATYFPDYNVVAGEAGREWMAVLARPKAFSEGGISGIKGYMEGKEMALTGAAALAGRGAGGHIVVDVNLGPELEARIIRQAVENAEVRVTQQMTRESPLSRATRALNQSP